MSYDYDAVVLGGGGAGYTAAFGLSDAGMNVLMLDPKGELGGNCLFEGCIPSKTYWLGAKSTESMPFCRTSAEIDFKKLVGWKNEIQEKRFAQHRAEIGERSTLVFMPEEGRLVDEHTVSVGQRRITGKYVVVATGSEPVVPENFRDGITTHDLLKPDTPLVDVPETLGIIGGGYIGIEMAGIFAKLGSQVTIFCNRILPPVSQEIQLLLERRLIELGVKLERQKAKGVKFSDGSKAVLLDGGSKKFSEVLVAVGRRPNLRNISLEFRLNSRGFIDVSPGMRTQYGNIFAPGDVNGKHMLFHVAVQEGWIAARNILEGGRERMLIDYSSVPYAVYSDPQVAWTGLWKEDATGKGFDVECRRYALAGDARMQIENSETGWIDIVVIPGTGRIIGAQAVGADADLVIGELSIILSQGISIYELSRISQPHPTQLEGIIDLSRRLKTDG
ncbi:MAG: FAD-dependent oxidoreductase [Thermoplasmata archaeon]|jgi:dihydrolipoamide dehydrogenase|nr:FAD-dependent oxidoreductase [Candidatus Sysuiplasma jiujiangense]MBX8639500.1 FAD-dependent oxidoreductase [Candidatus Sysuiplasma jiujiangense]MBX8641242.1 FAD-dependent oxidoreductase [Candidatus Sysuiplasma jiujiangense]